WAALYHKKPKKQEQIETQYKINQKTNPQPFVTFALLRLAPPWRVVRKNLSRRSFTRRRIREIP
ncbi:MAG: hypothetical protein KAI59_00330, partial [Planctomycetes bacterium]|nr:hypothetical protein [Planctomycetota bacterium]